ncbi:MAG: arylsulfatase [Bacteroidales bacterium]|jgi:arylsulfatase A-like enzyme|nr:arylsulfatase [Bacteroidales bacterium]
MNKTGIICSVSLLSAVNVWCSGKPKLPKQPNIIYILADDLGYGDLGCYGQAIIQTPHIDRLAAEGMLFTRHYAGCTVSAPSRSSLFTGLHTGHAPIRANRAAVHIPRKEGQHPQPGDTYTIAKMLKGGGYATGCFGKWGLGFPGSEGAPENQGIDEFFGYNCQAIAHNYYPYYLWHNRDTVWLKGNEGAKKEDYAADIIHREAMEFIRANSDRPFFACLTYTLPHAELVSPDDSIQAMYRGKLPETPFRGVDGGSGYKTGGYGSSSHPKADFAAMVTRLDSYVGEVIAELKKLGLDKNTLVIFASDNGPHREGGADPDFFKSYGPLRGIKRDMYEGGIRVPMIAWYPGKVKAGSVTDHVSAFWDIMPTFAELTGTKAAGHTDGISFAPTLLGKSRQKKHDYLYWEFHEQGGKAAVIKGNWKAIRLNVENPEKTKVELYDLSKDTHEDHNVAGQHPEIVAELDRIMREAHTDSEAFPFAYPVGGLDPDSGSTRISTER